MNRENRKLSVAFVCTAKVCRSVMAHAICTAEVASSGLPVDVHSAGTVDFRGAAPSDYAWIARLQHQTPVTKMESTFIGELDFAAMDTFLVMEQVHLDALTGQFRVCPPRQRSSAAARQALRARKTAPCQSNPAQRKCHGLRQRFAALPAICRGIPVRSRT